MKVYIQIVDSKTGIYQCGMIDELIIKGFEIQNALKHFGVDYSSLNLIEYNHTFYVGTIENTTKFVTIICI